MKMSNLSHVDILENAFVCGNLGFHLRKKPDITSIINLYNGPYGTPGSVTKNIISQLTIVLSLLKHYAFTHGNATLSSLIFTSDPTSYTYDNYKISSPFTLKLTGFEDSGISLDNFRFFSRSLNADIILSSNILGNLFKIKTITRNNTNIVYYKFEANHKAAIYSSLKNMGAPMFYSSFDMYSFLLSLMSYPQFYYSFSGEKTWMNLWMPTQLDQVNNKLLELHRLNKIIDSLDDIIQFISGIWLRCDGLVYLLNNYGSYGSVE